MAFPEHYGANVLRIIPQHSHICEDMIFSLSHSQVAVEHDADQRATPAIVGGVAAAAAWPQSRSRAEGGGLCQPVVHPLPPSALIYTRVCEVVGWAHALHT